MECFMVRMTATAALVVLLVSTLPVAAQGIEYPLFDRFNFRLEGSAVGMATTIRLDSTTLGRAPPSTSRMTSVSTTKS